MTEITPSPDLLSTLDGKVAVITGGANGIGAQVVRLFSKFGAKVLFCDLDETRGQALEQELGTDRAVFVKCDITDYAQQYAMFEAAVRKWERIDLVVANAGVPERGDIYGENEDLSKPPSTLVLDVNLTAVVHTTRLAIGYMRRTGGGSLVLVSSVAAFKEAPGLWEYGAAKHGLYGMLRGLRPVAPERWGISVNMICPWMTKTGMVDTFAQTWYKEGLPTNEPADVAMAIAVAATANNGKHGHPGSVLPFNGKAVYVAGGRFFEVEDKIQELEPQWLGEQNSRDLNRGQAVLSGADWTEK